jgi:hypothetical protein
LAIAAACGGTGKGSPTAAPEPSAAPTAVPSPPASPTAATEGEFQIAYVDDDQRDIWVVPADGVGEQNVTRDRCPRLLEPYWSPRGDRIACIGTGSAAFPETQVLVFDLDGRLLFDLQRDALFAGFSWPDMMEMSPSSLWSPNGQYLAYAVEEDLTPVPEGGPPRGTPHLFIAEAEEGRIRKAISGGQQPRWSADGRRIAYNQPPDDTLVLYEPATGEEKVLGKGLRPLAWVLEDTSLLVAAGFQHPQEFLVEYEANLLDLSSGEMTRVPELDNNAEFWLSPDGIKAVVLKSGPSLGVLDLMTLRLTDIAGSVISYPSEYIPRHQLTFTPDGSRIYWFDGNEAIYSANSDGTGLTQIGPLRDVNFFLGFSPDVTQALFLPGAGGPGLWVANVDGSDAHLVADNASTTPLYAAWGPQLSLTKPITIDGIRVVPLQFGEEAELPKDVALIIETGCFSCDGPTTALIRVYRDASGEVRTDTLFTAKATGLPPRAVSSSKEGTWPEQPYIHSFALSSDASEIVVSVCSHGYCQWIDQASPDAQMTLFRSLDGGVTWAEFGVIDGWSRVVAIAKESVVLWGSDPVKAEPEYRLFPSGDPVQPPPQAEDNWPLSLPSGELIWRTKDGRLVRSDGSGFLALGEGASFVNAWRRNIELDPSGKRMATTWRSESSGRNYLGVAGLDGQVTDVFSLGEYAMVGGWVNSRLLAGNASIASEELYLPALFDLDAAQLHLIPHPFLDPPFRNGRNFVQAVLRGPFARVVETGSCLKVRAEPGMAASVLTCAADDVLLRDTGETQEVDGTTWRRVVTPAGLEGWASSQYLER